MPRRLGYVHEATLRKRRTHTDGSSRDTMIWTLLLGEYPASAAAGARVEAFDALGARVL